jgi:hypothetical protein
MVLYSRRTPWCFERIYVSSSFGKVLKQLEQGSRHLNNIAGLLLYNNLQVSILLHANKAAKPSGMAWKSLRPSKSSESTGDLLCNVSPSEAIYSKKHCITFSGSKFLSLCLCVPQSNLLDCFSFLAFSSWSFSLFLLDNTTKQLGNKLSETKETLKFPETPKRKVETSPPEQNHTDTFTEGKEGSSAQQRERPTLSTRCAPKK